MITIKHPTLSATRQVKSSEVSRWTAAGWVRATKKESAPTEKPESKPGESAKK